MKHSISVVLLEPQIPQNTGNIARLCAATQTQLDLVGPLGFSLEDKYLRRAGLDYWPWVSWHHYEDRESYLKSLDPSKTFLLSARSEKSYTQVHFPKDANLVFGHEVTGIPEHIQSDFPNQCLTIPHLEPAVRSLNLSTAVGIVLCEALRQNQII